MTNIDPNKKTDAYQSIGERKEIAASTTSKQILSSEKDLLKTHLEKANYRFKDIPILGGIVRFLFGEQIAKTRYLDQIKQKAAKQFADYKFSNPKQFANKTFNAFKNLDMVHLQRLERFIESRGAPLFFFKGDPIALLIKVPEENLPYLEESIRLVEHISSDQEKLQQGLTKWLNKASSLSSEKFKEDVTSFLKAGLEQVKDRFIKVAHEGGTEDKEAQIQAQEIIENKLQGKDIPTLTHALILLTAGNGALLLDKDTLSKNIDKILAVEPRYRKTLEEMVRLEPQISQMLGSVFTPIDRKSFITACLDFKEVSKSFSKTTTLFKNFCNELQSVQNERPTIHTSNEKIASILENVEFHVLISKVIQVPFLSSLCNELLDRSLPTNSQLVGESVGSFIKSPEEGTIGGRYIASLGKRTEVTYSLSKEFHPEETWYEDGEEEVDLTGKSIRLSITNEKTGETRTLHTPLPIKGKMSKTEARRQLKLLESLIISPRNFDSDHQTAYEYIQNPPEKERMKKTFNEWAEKSVKECYAMIFDFNATEKRPIFSYAKEQSAVKEALAAVNRKNKDLALKAARGQNLFGLEKGELSLLPPEIASKHPEIGQISKETLRDAKKALQEQNTTPIKIDLPGEKKGKITFTLTSDKIRNEPYTWIVMEITQEGKASHIRKALIKGTDIQSYTNSPRLERDILLAKGEFFEKNY